MLSVMKRFLPRFFLLALGLSWAAALPALAQVTGINVITVPSANWALGSKNNLALEFQFTGSGSDNWQSVTIFDNGSAQIGGGDNLSNVNIWYQPSSSVFSPGSAVSVGSPPAIDHFQWQNGPDNGAPVFNFPFTVGAGYYFMTLDMGTNPIPVTDLGPNETAGVGIVSSGVSFLNTGTLGNAQVSNPNVGTVVFDSNVTSVTDQSIASANLAPGSVNNPVLGLKVTVAGGGTALFQDLQVTNGGTAGNNDISQVKVWDQPGGGNFDPATAVYLGPLSFASPNWTDGGVAYNWNINTGDIIYVTVNISTAGFANNSTCLFTVPSGGIVCTGFTNSAAIANPNGQVITAPTATPTITPTASATNTPPAPTATFTQTPTPTVTATATHTPVVATPNPTATNTPPAPTPTPIPVVSATPTPVPGVALSLSSNFFTPGSGLTLQVQVVQAGQVKVEIFNLTGERVRRILNAALTKGSYTYTWDGKNDQGLVVGNGVYFILIQSPSGHQVQKVILLK